MKRPFTRRDFLKTTALATTAAIAAPHVRGAHAAGKLTLGIWDHWVPGANDNMTKLCQEWGEKTKTEIQIDYLTSVGDKDIITATAEAQAGAGHDIMTHRALAGGRAPPEARTARQRDGGPRASRTAPTNEVANFLAKHDGHWYAIPTSTGSQVKPCCSSSTCTSSMPASTSTRSSRPATADQKLTDTWTWDTYLESATKLKAAGFPVGIPIGQTSDAVDWVGALFRVLRRRDDRREGQDHGQLRRHAPGAGIRQEAGGADAARRLRLGRRVATIAG